MTQLKEELKQIFSLWKNAIFALIVIYVFTRLMIQFFFPTKTSYFPFNFTVQDIGIEVVMDVLIFWYTARKLKEVSKLSIVIFILLTSLGAIVLFEIMTVVDNGIYALTR